MKEGKPTDRSETVRDAATQYAFNRWQSLRPRLTLSVLGATLALLSIPIGRLSRPDAKTWHLVLLVAAIACYVGYFWMMRKRLRGGWRGFIRERILRIQQDAGVVVEEPTFRSPKWWHWPFSFVVGPVYVLAIMLLSARSPVHLQPLIVAGGVTVPGLVIRSAMDKRARSYWRPVHFLAWGLYCCYALAVAAGMAQPFADVTGSWQGLAWPLRILVPLFLFSIVEIVARELYSRRQFRRLQSLLAEEAGKTEPDAGD